MARNDWITPIWLIERVRGFLGEIDLDPASSAEANELVRAQRFYNEQESGLENEWFGRVFLNPPYSQPLANLFTERFLKNDFHEGILLCNFDSSTRRCQNLMAQSSFCLLNRRIAFIDPETFKPVKGNRFAQALFYKGENGSRFAEAFSDLGLSIGGKQ